MSIDNHPDGKPLAGAAPRSWGEFAPDGETAVVVRFLLEQSAVTIPLVQFKRWDHSFGLPETLAIQTGAERVIVEGRDLAEVRAALDLGRLCELRVNYPSKSGTRPGPQIRRIMIEAA